MAEERRLAEPEPDPARRPEGKKTDMEGGDVVTVLDSGVRGERERERRESVKGRERAAAVRDLTGSAS